MDVERFKRPLRAVRAWPPLNVPVTAAIRAGVRALGRPPGLLSRFLPRVGLVEAPLPDGAILRMWSRADDDVTPQVYWNGWAGHEPETAPLFYDYARTARATFDVGAHVGYFALLAAHANPAGRVYAFEPHPLAHERLTRNSALNHLSNLWCEPLAVGSEEAVAEFFHVSEGIHSSSSLSQDFMESIVDRARLVSSKVDVVALDEYATKQGIDQVDLIKIDTETTEEAVFRGMTSILLKHKPVVFCEILQQSAAEKIEAVLQPFGYRFFLLEGKGPRLCAHISPDPAWRNFCLVPDSRPDPVLAGRSSAGAAPSVESTSAPQFAQGEIPCATQP